MLSHLRTSGAGLLQLIADADGDLDGSLQITAQVQVYGASGRRNGTVFMAANSFKIQPGARVHLDQGDLLVTAVNFAFGPAPLCRTRSELSGELNLPENQAFLVRSNTTPGVAYFEPFPASISSITSSVPVLLAGVGERGKGRARFATAGGDVLTVSGSAFGPWDLDASFSLYVGDAECALLPRDRHMPSIVPQSGAQVSVGGVREYKWLLLNGMILRRFAYSFRFACALPAGTGASLDVFVLAGGCAGGRREQSLLGYAAPQIASILPASVLVKGAEGGGVLLTFLGASFGVSEPSLSAASAACEKAGNTDAFAAYLKGVGARDGGVGGGVAVGGGGGGAGGGSLVPCSSVQWTSDSSVECALASVPRVSAATAIVVVSGQAGSGGRLDLAAQAAFFTECEEQALGRACPAGDCKADCLACCRRSCHLQWLSDDRAREAGGGLHVATMSTDAYANCAVLCADFCKDTPHTPRDWQ
jgi:hypothetical protein